MSETQLLQHCLELAEMSAEQWNGPQQAERLSRLDAEHESFKTVLKWATSTKPRPEEAQRLCIALQSYWRSRNLVEEGLNYSIAALQLSAPLDAMRARLLNDTGVLCRMLGRFDDAMHYHAESLKLRHELGDLTGVAACYNGMGNVASDSGNYAEARRCYEKSLAIKVALGNRRAQAGSLNNLAFAAFRNGDYESASDYYRKSLAIWCEFDDRMHIGLSLQGFAEIAAAQGQLVRAVHLWAASHALQEQHGSALAPNEKEAQQDDIRKASEALGEQAFVTAWTLGLGLTMERAVEVALVRA